MPTVSLTDWNRFLPTVNIRGESYRLREKLKAGLLKPKLGSETLAAAEHP